MPSSRLPITDDQMRVSSVHAKDADHYIKEHILDGNPSTHWLSEGFQGANQWIMVKFPSKVRLDEIRVQFRKGFAAKSFSIRNLDPHDHEVEMYFPDDTDDVQVFPVPSNKNTLQHIKLAFDCSFDFYGKIGVASLEFYGASAQ